MMQVEVALTKRLQNLNLGNSVIELPGVGPSIEEKLSRLGIQNEISSLNEESSFWNVRNTAMTAGLAGFGIGIIAFVVWARRPFTGN